MAYIEDDDLEFLKNCNNEELKTLFDILTIDSSNGEEFFWFNLKKSKEWFEHGNNYVKYWKRIAEELQLFGGDSIMNLKRLSSGVKYREIANDICDWLSLEIKSDESIQNIEEKILNNLNPTGKNLTIKKALKIFTSSIHPLSAFSKPAYNITFKSIVIISQLRKKVNHRIMNEIYGI